MTITEAKSIMIRQRSAFLDEYIDYGRVEEAYNMAIKALEESERKKGKWQDNHRQIFDGTFYWFRECSVCGYERNDDDSEKDTNFCPNCGADMRGEQE